MGDGARALLYKLATSRLLNRATLRGLEIGWSRLGAQLLPREWLAGIDSFFVRGMIGNVDEDSDGSPDSFRLTVNNAWFDQRVEGVEMSIDGRRVKPDDLLLRMESRTLAASDVVSLDFPPGVPLELIARGQVLADGLHLLELTVHMELASQIIPIVPLEVRAGAGDFPILEDKFRPPPEWPPVALIPGTAHVVPHIHYDVEWLRTREVFEAVGAGNLREMLRLLEADPEMTFATDQVPQLEPFMRRDPEGFEKLVRLVEQGRIEPLNGLFAEPDVNLISGEAIVRQSVAWQRYALATFGRYSRCGWLPDSFGMCAQLPQIFLRSGTEFFAFSRAPIAPELVSEFIWEGPDGSRILTHNMTRMYNVGHPVPSERARALRKMLVNYERLRARSSSANVFYPCGVDHGRPQAAYGEAARAWNSEVKDVRFEFSLPSKFFDSLESDDLPVLRGEFQRELWGTYSARTSLKQLDRECEFALLDAGKMAAVAWIRGAAATREQELEALWEKLFACQFHDQICGCCVDEVATGMARRFAEVAQGAAEIMARSAEFLAPRTREVEGGAMTVLAFNPLAQPVAEVAEVEVELPPGWTGVGLAAQGEEISTQVVGRSLYGDGTLKTARLLFKPALPGLGYRLFEVVPRGSGCEADGPGARAQGTMLSNGQIEVEIDGSSGLLGRVALADGTTFDLTGANKLTLERDFGDLYIAGSLGTTWLRRPRVSSVRVVEDGPLRAVVEVRGTLGRSPFTQKISLAAGSRRIDIETLVDFKDPRHRLRARFPTGIEGGRWVHEVPYAWIERPGHELPAQNFVDVSGGGRGVTLINTGLPANKLDGDTICLTLMRSVDKIYSWDAGAGALETGSHTFCYSLYPHRGDHVAAGSVLEAYRHNDPPRVFVLPGRPDADAPAGFGALECEAAGVMVTAFEARNHGVIARAWEASGAPAEAELALGFEVERARKCDLLERPERELAAGGNRVALPLGPFEIATLRLDR